jgi:hypothetical protein
MINGVFREQPVRPEVDVDDPLPVLKGCLRYQAVDVDCSIVDQDVDAPEDVDRPLDRRLDGFRSSLSVLTKIASWPSARMSFVTLFPASSSRSQTTTEASSLASRLAVVLPIPFADPVTMATVSSSA